MKRYRWLIVLIYLVIFFNACSPSKKAAVSMVNDTLLADLLKTDPFLRDSILPFAPELKFQIIYTTIDRSPDGTPSFTDHGYDLHPDEYYYPASTV
ncbi:MAG TPA: hypothetical protein VK644_13480, partial [Chitinophagaceae bacterium]|nr:hypothetical protein [Chitinophagaceae bacterium]